MRMLERRSEAIARGERVIGWKLAFGAPASMEKFGLTGPVVGFLTDATRHDAGSTISCAHWSNPVAEPEVAAHIGQDVESPAQVANAISALSAAIELADVDPPPDDIETALAGNIFHKAVIIGEPDRSRGSDGLRASITRNGREVAEVVDVAGLTGDFISILGHAAGLLIAAGALLRKDDVVILGSIVPPIRVQTGDEIGFALAHFPAISVHV